MITIDSNIDAVLTWLATLEAKLRGALAQIVRDPVWGPWAADVARDTLAAHGCPAGVAAELLKTLRVAPVDVHASRWTIGGLQGLIQQAMALAQHLHVSTRTAAGKVTQEQYLMPFTGAQSEIVTPGAPPQTVFQLRRNPTKTAEQDALLQNVRDLVRAWVYAEKDLNEKERADPEIAVDNVLGVLGLHGAGSEDGRKLWGRVLKGGKAEGFEAGPMSEQQASAAGRIAAAIAAWVAAGGATADALDTPPSEDTWMEPASKRLEPLLSLASSGYANEATGTMSSGRIEAAQQLSDWLRAVAAAWEGLILARLPEVVWKHLRAAAEGPPVA